VGRTDSGSAANVSGNQAKAATVQKIEGDKMNDEHQEGIAHDEKQRCPLCGSSEVEIHYVDDGVEPMTGYVMSGYVFECHDCGERGEWE